MYTSTSITPTNGVVDSFNVSAPILKFTYTQPGTPTKFLIGNPTLASTAKQLDLDLDGGTIEIKATLVITAGTTIGTPGDIIDLDLSFSIGGNKERIRFLPEGQTLSGGSLRKGRGSCRCFI